jgi:hypothetical protein
MRPALADYVQHFQPVGSRQRFHIGIEPRHPKFTEGNEWKWFRSQCYGYQLRVEIAQIDLDLDRDLSKVVITLHACDKHLLESLLMRACPEIQRGKKGVLYIPFQE